MKKGFTLFTALVAIMVVFLGVLIIQTMIRGERNSVEIVSTIEEEAEMLDFASLRKTDAIHEFNYGLRSAFETYFIRDTIGPLGVPDGVPDEAFVLNSDIITTSSREDQWNQIQTAFVNQNFGDFSQCALVNVLDADDAADLATTEGPNAPCKAWSFVEFIADEIRTNLTLEKTEGAYISSLDYPEIPQYEKVFRKILLEIFSRSAVRGEFLETSDCSGDYFSGCDGGGFYINLDFGPLDNSTNPPTGISDEIYEALPQIKVKKKDTCLVDDSGSIITCSKVLRQPIFPRSNLRVFVPTRIFKALRGAHEFILAQDNGKLIFDDDSDFKSKIKELKLGVCDSYMKDVYWDPPPGPDDEPPFPVRLCAPVIQHICYPRTNFFTPQTTTNFSDACIGTEPAPTPANSLSNVSIGSGISYDPNDETSMRGAIIKFVKETYLKDKLGTNNPLVANLLSANTPKFEILTDGDNILWDRTADHKSFISRNISPGGTSFCTKVAKISGTLVFQEKNELYKIDSANDVKFAVKIEAEFNPSFGTPRNYNRFAFEASGNCTTVGGSSCPDPNNYKFGSC